MIIKKILLSFLLFCSYCAVAQKKNYQVSAIAFYNFENLFDTEDDPKNWGDDEFLPTGPYRYTQEIYEQKLHNLATVIKQLGTDVTPDGAAIIGTAEIENDKVLQDLTQQPEIKERGYKFIHFDSPDSRGIDVAMLYNPKYFKVLFARTLNTNISKFGEKGGKTRDVLYVNGVLLGDTINVFVNHWPSRRGGEAATAPLRAIAASVSKRIIDSLKAINPRTKSIVMGDFNDDPIDLSITKVLGATGEKNKVGKKGLFNPFVNFYKSGIGTLGYDDRWNLFDQIIISGSFLHASENEWKYYKAEVFNKEFLKNSFGRYKGYPHRSFDGNRWLNGYSDHFPTIVYFVKEVK
ncbi:MAG TPA: endonuclease/exonuclease/phosphatase [Flavipsychrobacter sp.]|nr:endonuclease/exonuclease/phosphatase [Flavipsychrobacter sp.]